MHLLVRECFVHLNICREVKFRESLNVHEKKPQKSWHFVFTRQGGGQIELFSGLGIHTVHELFWFISLIQLIWILTNFDEFFMNMNLKAHEFPWTWTQCAYELSWLWIWNPMNLSKLSWTWIPKSWTVWTHELPWLWIWYPVNFHERESEVPWITMTMNLRFHE